jgi:hypothetical protein
MARSDKPEQKAGVLEMKLGACLTAPTKRAVADLHAVAHECNVARNGIIRFWERKREDDPDWKPGQRRDRKGESKVAKSTTSTNKKFPKKKIIELLKSGAAKVLENNDIVYQGIVIGKENDAAVMEHPAMSQDLENQMYTKGTELAPNVACGIVAQLRTEVVDRLKSRLPYTHTRETGGVCKFRWEGILQNEVARDTYRAIHIPAPNSMTIFSYCGKNSRSISKNVDARIADMSKSGCVVRLALFSRESGRENLEHVFRVEAGQLPKGKRAILHRIATQEWKLCDSKLVFKRDAWYFQLTYKQPQKDLKLDKKNVANLFMCPATRRQPFVIGFQPEQGKLCKWDLGDSVVLLAEYQRLIMRRKVIQNRYKNASTGRKGHGKQRAFRPMRPMTRRANDLIDAFTNNVVASIIKFCVRFNCGSVLYREPGLLLRTFSWFEKNTNKVPIPYNWTKLLSKIKHKCWINGIDLEVQRMGIKDHRAMFDDSFIPDVKDEKIEDPQPHVASV